MDIKLQPDFAEWIERESSKLPLLVEDLTELAKATGAGTHHPDERATVTITERDIIGEPEMSLVDITGKSVARFYWHNRKYLGLRNEKLVEVLKFAEKIFLRKELRDVLSIETVREIVLSWVGDIARNRASDKITTRIYQAIREKVKPLVIWIPIEDTLVTRELKFADAILRMVSQKELYEIADLRLSGAPPGAAEQFKDKLRRHWLGKAVMCISFEAEPRRAHELALEKAEVYMALLQFYGWAPVVWSLTSYAAPSGARPRRTRLSMALHSGNFAGLSQGLLEKPSYLAFDDNFRSAAENRNLGFAAVSALALQTTCEYEEILLRSLLVYGRACYQNEPIDKLLQIITAVEMLTLRNDNEPISITVADRVAFAIARRAEQRRSVADNFKKVYGIRSRKTHHGQTISETEEVEIFLNNIREFFLQSIRCVGKFKTKAEFLDRLEHLKYI